MDTWQYCDIEAILREIGIDSLYHITDKDNIQSILKERGIFSWRKLREDGVISSRPGGTAISHRLDEVHQLNLDQYVHLYAAKPSEELLAELSFSGLFSELCVLSVSLQAIRPERVLFWIGDPHQDGKRVSNISELVEILRANPSLKADLRVDLYDSVYYHYLDNIPEDISQRVSEVHPTAIVFIVDQSCSMARATGIADVNFDYISELAAVIINEQIERLVNQCVSKEGIVNHLFDIAVIGYGDSVSPAWNAGLSDNFFHSPSELLSHNCEESHLRWVAPKDSDKRGRCHDAFNKVFDLLSEWIARKENRFSYPPTVIHISDGDVKREYQRDFLLSSQKLKELSTEIGHVMLWNIGLLPVKMSEFVFLSGEELPAIMYFPGGLILYEASSYLPQRFKEDAATIHHGDSTLDRKTMGINVSKNTLSRMLQMCILPDKKF